LEKRTATKIDPNNPVATYGFSWIWRELGINELGR